MEALKKLLRQFKIRLMLSVCLVLFIGILTLLATTYYLLGKTLVRKDHALIQAKTDQIVSRAEHQSDLKSSDLLNSKGEEWVFLQLLSPKGEILFTVNPYRDDAFQLDKIPHSLIAPNQWDMIPETDDEDILEVYSSRLPDGKILQVGRSSSSRESELESFLGTYLGLTSLILIISFFLGLFIVKKSLLPIQSLLRAMTEVTTKGNVSTRVQAPGTNDELDHLVSFFNQMLEKIEKLLKAHRAIIDDVAHDIRTPIARMRMAAELAIQSSSSQVQTEALSDVLENTDQISRLVNTILDISGVESGAIQLNLSQVIVKKLINRVADLYEGVAAEKNITIKAVCEYGSTFILDELQISRALANMLDNSCKYAQSDSEITLQASLERSNLVFKITDRGPGILEKDRPHVWNRLYRADQSRSQIGMGLGLSLVKVIIESHGGHVSVESEAGKGSTFSLSIPEPPNSHRPVKPEASTGSK